MSIVRNDGDERQTRDHMIEEFRRAQSRRLAKALAVRGGDQGDQGAEFQRDVHAQDAAEASMPTPRTSH